ncbi:hypothetical protein ACJ41O_012464 [Fusarium nematophilum]
MVASAPDPVLDLTTTSLQIAQGTSGIMSPFPESLETLFSFESLNTPNLLDFPDGGDGWLEEDQLSRNHSWWPPAVVEDYGGATPACLDSLGGATPSLRPSLTTLSSAKAMPGVESMTTGCASISSVSEERLSHLQRLWAQGTDRKTSLISTIWHDLTVGDGIFGDASEPAPLVVRRGSITNGRKFDQQTIESVSSVFRGLLGGVVDSPGYSTVITPEMLDIAFEQYIIHHHNVLPLIHLPCFDPRKAPVNLLTVMCTIGLSAVGSRLLDKFISRIFPVRYHNSPSRHREGSEPPSDHMFKILILTDCRLYLEQCPMTSTPLALPVFLSQGGWPQ